METVTVVRVVRTAKVVVDVTVVVVKVESSVVWVPLDLNVVVLGTKHEQAELMPETAFDVHIEA